MQRMPDSYILWAILPEGSLPAAHKLICRYGKGLKGQWDADEQLLSGYLARLHHGMAPDDRKGRPCRNTTKSATSTPPSRTGEPACMSRSSRAFPPMKISTRIPVRCSMHAVSSCEQRSTTNISPIWPPHDTRGSSRNEGHFGLKFDDLDSFVGILLERISRVRPVPKYERWARDLEAMILRGHLLRPSDLNGIDTDLELQIGKMVEKPFGWQWTEITEDESHRLGYPEHPGVILR
ncbi:hypothetical protein EVG20_g11465 [Dentipellis fragilis]|uniref:Uncharacterized protein n=1 Tax=Dentipellis fragilis TaxID=205917 RepID=A0A4Y9XLF4_9AGAM|nr:hypothetical protein EVG20_g11465 [Dentipellis fragilis]